LCLCCQLQKQEAPKIYTYNYMYTFVSIKTWNFPYKLEHCCNTLLEIYNEKAYISGPSKTTCSFQQIGVPYIQV
jgi:hypothetical protein